MQFAITNGLSVGFLNLSLAFNSVGCALRASLPGETTLALTRPVARRRFYQMTKLAIIPFTVLLQTLFYGRSFSTPVKATLGVLLLGVAVATVNDVELNFLGTVVSVGAIVLTCVSQIWTGTMQKAHTVSSTQLLHGAAPLMGATLLAVGIPLDRMLMTPAGELFTFSVPSCTYIVLSCIIAVSVNFSTFLVIGRCDAVTYQVLGHLKTVLILVLGFVVLKNPANPRAIAGIVLAMVGMMVRARMPACPRARVPALWICRGRC